MMLYGMDNIYQLQDEYIVIKIGLKECSMDHQ